MKAAIRRRYCPPDQIRIESIKTPVPSENEVLIKVHFTTVNRTDCANLTAKPFIMRFVLGFFKPRKIVLGTDFAGEVTSIGKKVKNFDVGDRVFGFLDSGTNSQAEYTIARDIDIFRIPENISYREAAASLEGAHYAFTFIHKTNIQPGQKVLINGASGGIGSALLQFVKQFNVKISATCATKDIQLIKLLGAEKVFDYTNEDFTQDSEKYDYIFDAVGKSTYGKCKPLLKDKGIYISSELGPHAQNIFYSILTASVIFPVPYSPKKTVPYIINLLEKGLFKPVIDREYYLDDISEAYKYVIGGNKTGNVVVNNNINSI